MLLVCVFFKDPSTTGIYTLSLHHALPIWFGRGKVSSLMGEVGKGITAFKKGVNDGANELEEEKAAEAKDVTPETEKDKA